jgi:hypothetical protein
LLPSPAARRRRVDADRVELHPVMVRRSARTGAVRRIVRGLRVGARVAVHPDQIACANQNQIQDEPSSAPIAIDERMEALKGTVQKSSQHLLRLKMQDNFDISRSADLPRCALTTHQPLAGVPEVTLIRAPAQPAKSRVKIPGGVSLGQIRTAHGGCARRTRLPVGRTQRGNSSGLAPLDLPRSWAVQSAASVRRVQSHPRRQIW